MADFTSDGKTKIAYAASLSNPAAPTTAEIAAGLALSPKTTADGMMGFQPETAGVTTASIESTFDTSTRGRVSFSGMALRFKKQTGTDTIYDTLVLDAAGYILVRRDVAASTAWTAGQKVEVYPVICGETKRLDPEGNTLSRYEVPLFLTEEPELRATVA